MRFSPHVLAFAVFPCLLAACASGPEYEEPAVTDPHGVLEVKPLLESGQGGGLRTIDGLLVFPKGASREEMAEYRYRAWRVSPGMRRVEIFAGNSTIKRTVRIHDGRKLTFLPKKFVDAETGGDRLVVGHYVFEESDLSGGSAPPE